MTDDDAETSEPRPAELSRRDPPPEQASGEVVEEQRQTIQFLEARLHQGPLPSGEALVEYDRARPGTSNEIVEEWREEARQRRELQRLTVTAAIRSRDRGQWIGAGFALLVIVGGFAAIFTGHSLAGLAALVLAAAAVAGRFFSQRTNGQNSLTTRDTGEAPPDDEGASP